MFACLTIYIESQLMFACTLIPFHIAPLKTQRVSAMSDAVFFRNSKWFLNFSSVAAGLAMALVFEAFSIPHRWFYIPQR
jgi:hypothetical protein